MLDGHGLAIARRGCPSEKVSARSPERATRVVHDADLRTRGAIDRIDQNGGTMSLKNASRIGQLVHGLALAALVTLGGCPKEEADYSVHPPALSAPLLRAPNSDEEVQNLA